MRKLMLLSLFVRSFCVLGAERPVHLLPGTVHTGLTEAQAAQMLKGQFDEEKYRRIAVQPIANRHGAVSHLLVYLFAKGFHRVDFARVDVDASFNVTGVQRNYRPKAEDTLGQPGLRASFAQCPDDSVEFLAFAPNDDDLEQSITAEVVKAAQAKNLRTVALLQGRATRQNYLDYLTCPKLRGNFYDGDANPSAITTVDGEISSDDVSTVLKGKFRLQVTNIWLACEAYNDPMLSAVVDDAQAKKYAAGINDLEIGPSDRAGACAMEAAIAGQPLTKSFYDCVSQYDDTNDEWGFGGNGSDAF